MKTLFDQNSTLWKQPKTGWRNVFNKPGKAGFFGKIKAGLSNSAASRNRSIVETPLSFAAHRGLTFLASTIPMASLVFDSLTIAHIIQQFDPKFKIAPNQLSDEAYKRMLLAHVENKVLSENHGESQQGMMMLRTMRRYAERVSQQKTHPKNQPARQFLTALNQNQKHVDKIFQKRKENARGVAFHEMASTKGFAAAPTHMRKYVPRLTLKSAELARWQTRRRMMERTG